ncbi:hypothetical protein TNCV_970361 [Trichonephila clavipes]|nr:hypothetical protein TNCV_970361 [Trichonephila clavipes]
MKHTEYSIRPVSSALFSYRYDKFKADRVQTFRAHWFYARRPVRCVPLTATQDSPERISSPYNYHYKSHLLRQEIPLFLFMLKLLRSRNPVGNMDGSQISCAALRALALNSREQLIREQRKNPELSLFRKTRRQFR